MHNISLMYMTIAFDSKLTKNSEDLFMFICLVDMFMFILVFHGNNT